MWTAPERWWLSSKESRLETTSTTLNLLVHFLRMQEMSSRSFTKYNVTTRSKDIGVGDQNNDGVLFPVLANRCQP